MNKRLMFMYVICLNENVKSKGYKCNQLFFIKIFAFHNIIKSAIGEIIWHLCRCLGVSESIYLYFVYSKYDIELGLFKLSKEILGVRSIPVTCHGMEVSLLRPTPIYLSNCNNIRLIHTKNCASVITNTTNINQVTYISFHVHFTAFFNINNIVEHKNSSVNHEQ